MKNHYYYYAPRGFANEYKIIKLSLAELKSQDWLDFFDKWINNANCKLHAVKKFNPLKVVSLQDVVNPY